MARAPVQEGLHPVTSIPSILLSAFLSFGLCPPTLRRIEHPLIRTFLLPLLHGERASFVVCISRESCHCCCSPQPQNPRSALLQLRCWVTCNALSSIACHIETNRSHPRYVE